MSNHSLGRPQQESDIQVSDSVETPRRFKVLLLNDDFTPMDFVVYVLKRFFQKSPEEAENIMLEVHHKGQGVAGVYSKEVAEMKALQTEQYAKLNQYPLKTLLEPET